MSFPPATEMFQFAGFASRPYRFGSGSPLREGLPHSEIPGSTIARISPGLFAACHVLHRLLAPRHPPNALTSTLDHKTRRSQGQAPQINASRMKTLFPKLSAVSPHPEPGLKARVEGTAVSSRRFGSSPGTACRHHRWRQLFQILPLHCVKEPAGGRTRGNLRLLPIQSRRLRADRPAPRSAPCPAFGATHVAPAARDTNGASRHSAGGGGERDRTVDLLLAKQALSQLSYTPAAITP